MSQKNVELVRAALEAYNGSNREGAVVRVTLYRERDEALEAAGHG